MLITWLEALCNITANHGDLIIHLKPEFYRPVQLYGDWPDEVEYPENYIFGPEYEAIMELPIGNSSSSGLKTIVERLPRVQH